MGTLHKRLFVAMLVGFILGTLWLMMIRFVNYEREEVHYHANFAVYVDGEREEFDMFTFYEEVQSCGSDAVNNPHTRVHMHDMVNHVVHVHDHAATWGHFFANLGYVLGNDILKTDDGVFVDGQDGKRLMLRLNGEEIRTISNQTIKSEDVLLISYGNPDVTDLDAQYETIVQDAGEYNQRDDPSACKGGQPVTFTERLKHAVGLKQ